MINNKSYNKTSLILYVHAMYIHFSETSNNFNNQLILFKLYSVSLWILCMISCCVCSTNEKQYVMGNAFVKQMKIK